MGAPLERLAHLMIADPIADAFRTVVNITGDLMLVALFDRLRSARACRRRHDSPACRSLRWCGSRSRAAYPWHYPYHRSLRESKRADGAA